MNATTAGRREALLAQVRAREALARRRVERPLDFVPWLTFQVDVFRACPGSKRLLARAGNQALGKTTAGAAITIWRCLCQSPFFPLPTRKIRALLIASTATQSVEIQRKIKDLLPPGEVDWTKTHFDDRVGFGANRPMIFFENGSTLRIATNDQGPRALQGGTYDFIWIDEVPSPEVLREAERRLLTTGGPLLLTLTPINADATHIEKQVESGAFVEVHGRLTVENLTVERTGLPRLLADGTACDAAWIAEQRRIVPEQWAPILLDGEWRVSGLGAYYSKIFDRAVHVSDRVQLEPLDGEIRWHLGIDYASADRPAGMVATLVQVQSIKGQPGEPDKQWVIVEDCVVLPGTATVAMLVDDVLSMLSRAGLKWHHLHTVYGDNPVRDRHEWKGNRNFLAFLAIRQRKAQTAIRPMILNAKEGAISAGSRSAGAQYLYELVASKRLVLRTKAEPIVDMFETWIFKRDHPATDRNDSLRYALKDYVFSDSNPRRGMVLRLSR